MRLLLVEDEAAIAIRTRESLEEARYTVDWARDGVEALALAREREYAAIILDLLLPGVDGWEVCETLRRHRDPTPILMLTARGALEDRIRGFEIGADDYLPKPFALPELRVRVRALIRRSAVHRTRLIRIDDLEIDTEARRVSRSGREIPLTAREYTLLEALARNDPPLQSGPIMLAPEDHRRNLTVRGVPLNHLVGKRFRVGQAVLYGGRLNFPCRYIEELLGLPLYLPLYNRSGLNCRIEKGAVVRRGDPVEPLDY